MNSILKNMATRSGSIGVSSLPSSTSSFSRKVTTTSFLSLKIPNKSATSRRSITCSAVQESSTTSTSTSTSTVAGDTKEVKKVDEKPAAAPGAAKPKPTAKGKAPAKPLPQMMEEDVIPKLQSTLETEDDVTEIELSFNDNRLEGFFKKKDVPYSFWAYFPSGDLTGPRGFSISSYGSEVSTVEPFLIDEKKITEKHLIFWVQKRLAAQGIIPVWKE